jgi:hypothetical protein
MHLNQGIVNLSTPRPKGQGLPSARATRLSPSRALRVERLVEVSGRGLKVDPEGVKNPP